MKLVVALWLSLAVFTLGTATEAANEKLSDATRRFSLELLQQVLQRENGNFIVSPLSVSTLLSMVHQGANNQTAVQLQNLLHLSKEDSKIGFKNVIESFGKQKYKSKLEFANSIFVNTDFSILPNYKTVLQTFFHTQVDNTDFKTPATAAKRINDWVSVSSKNRIPELVTAESISGRTQIILANVIYFKGVWGRTFDVAKSVVEDFHLSPNNAVQTKYMTKKENYWSSEDVQLGARWLELPYDGAEFSMVIVLPIAQHGLNDLVARMTHEHLKMIMTSRNTKDVTIKMPRFKLNGEVELVPCLQKMGLIDIFDQRSNLEGISISKGPLVVSNILHKAEIEVNEQGTEASAASGIFVNTLSLTPDYEEVNFFVNQPFLAIIKDKVNNMPYFVARVSNPTLN